MEKVWKTCLGKRESQKYFVYFTSHFFTIVQLGNFGREFILADLLAYHQFQFCQQYYWELMRNECQSNLCFAFHLLSNFSPTLSVAISAPYTASV